MVRGDYKVHKFEWYLRVMWGRSFDNVFKISTQSQYLSVDVPEICDFAKDRLAIHLGRALHSATNRHLAIGGDSLE